MRRPNRRVGARLTREGITLAVLTLGIAVVAIVTGHNLLYMPVCSLLAMWALDAVLGSWNLRHVELRRELPTELFAGVEGRGAFLIMNLRNWLPSVAVHIEDGHAHATIDRLLPKEEVLAPTGWTFRERGRADMDVVRISSAFPFGLWSRWRALDLPAHVLVYPRPSPANPKIKAGLAVTDGNSLAGRGMLGDFDGLRQYQPGDPPRLIHWHTSARVGQPVVILRTDERADRVTVRVRKLTGRAWEHELSRACGEVLRAFHRGCRVGLELPGEHIEARGGPAWRRTLLEVLAKQPDGQTQ
ncbi:MAG: hypothetical protein ACI9MC_000784 [Kiritimatiellia bacterium]|jgi:uncharacterized protein (DUF58 family)